MMHLSLSWIRISPCYYNDMLAEGVHFSSEIDPFSLGKKVLAVNLQI